MKLNKVVITGAPGTGKTSIIRFLESNGYNCFHEFSRTLIKSGQFNGSRNLFLDEPNSFSEKILETRISHFNQSNKIKNPKNNLIFFDRSIYDTFAYQKFINKSFIYPIKYKKFKYQKVFILSPWNDIYVNDNERSESFEISKEIDRSIKLTYNHYNYKLNEISKTSVENRVNQILNLCL